MADELLMRGFWGPRPEVADDIGHRLAGFCRRLDHLLGSEGSWTDAEKVPVRLSDPSTARDFVQKTFDEHPEGESPLGVIIVGRAIFSDGAVLSLNATVGGYSQLATLKNNVVVKYRPAGDQLHLAARVFDLLIEEWVPDWGDLTSHALWDAVRAQVRLKSRTPRVGYVTYLSSGRTKSLPVELPARVKDVTDGGVLIGHFESSGQTLTPDGVAAADALLRATDAFAPVPTDRSHY